jgi:hypothetical protein
MCPDVYRYMSEVKKHLNVFHRIIPQDVNKLEDNKILKKQYYEGDIVQCDDEDKSRYQRSKDLKNAKRSKHFKNAKIDFCIGTIIQKI